MSATVLPFPLARRAALVARQAHYLAGMRPRAAEHNLFRQLQQQREALLRRGVDPNTVEREVRELEAAIRAALVAACYTPRAG